jgi:Tol biopolymer transport system component
MATARGGSCLIALVLVAGLAAPASGFHRQHPRLEQITRASAGSNDRPFVSSLARYVAFSSTADLAGGGGLGTSRQVFLRDQCPDFPFCLQRTLIQVTQAALPSDNPSLSRDGRYVAFESRADLLGNGSVGSHIYLYETPTHLLTQVTRGTGDDTEPRLSDSGRVVAFASTSDYFGSHAVGRQIYEVDLARQRAGCGLPVPCGGNPGLTQVTGNPLSGWIGATSGAYEAYNPTIDRQGHVVAFLSAADPTTPGVPQAYLANVSRRYILQLTHSPTAIRNPSLDQHGRLLAFDTTADLLGTLAPGSTASNVYFFDTRKSSVAALTMDSTRDSAYAAFGGPGKRLCFSSAADLLESGSMGAAVFQYDTSHLRLLQVTQSQPGNVGRTSTNDIFIALESTDDILVNGSTGQQLFMVNTFKNAPPPSTAIGSFTFSLAGPGGGSSTLQASSYDLSTMPPAPRTRVVPLSGSFTVRVNAADTDGKAGLVVSVLGFHLDPVPLLPELGNLCIHGQAGGVGFKITGNGVGFISCAGGLTGANVGPTMAVTQKHDLSETDLLCTLGCRENSACDTAPLGGHVTLCPGPPATSCPVCNGPVATAYGGTFPPGGTVFQMGLVIDISTGNGPDGAACTDDDDYAPGRVGPQIVTFTTGAASGAIFEADALHTCSGGGHQGAPCQGDGDCPGGTCAQDVLAHLSIATSGSGTPIAGTAPDCHALAGLGIAGATFVGEWPVIDLPGVGDTLFQLTLAAH